jgi:hypothetical protein
MKKQDAMNHWKALKPTDPLSSMTPIPYKTTGSRYGCCGIRIDGNPEFIDAVLSNLKTLLAGENHFTRLELARSEVKRQEGYNAGQNAGSGAQVCYIRLHVRGGEAQHMSMFYDRSMDSATEQYADAIGA